MHNFEKCREFLPKENNTFSQLITEKLCVLLGHTPLYLPALPSFFLISTLPF
jgi:hypothetical protein